MLSDYHHQFYNEFLIIFYILFYSLYRISELFRHNAVQCGWSTTSRFVDIEEQFERLVDGNDLMLENIVCSFQGSKYRRILTDVYLTKFQNNLKTVAYY